MTTRVLFTLIRVMSKQAPGQGRAHGYWIEGGMIKATIQWRDCCTSNMLRRWTRPRDGAFDRMRVMDPFCKRTGVFFFLDWREKRGEDSEA